MTGSTPRLPSAAGRGRINAILLICVVLATLHFTFLWGPSGCTGGCSDETEVSIRPVFPLAGGDLAVVALVAFGAVGFYPVLACSPLVWTSEPPSPLTVRVASGTMLRVVVFTYDSAELAALIVPGTDPATLPDVVPVRHATSEAQALPSEGRSDFVSAPFLPGDLSEVTVVAVSGPDLEAVADETAAQLAFGVPSDAGVGSDGAAATDGGGDGGG